MKHLFLNHKSSIFAQILETINEFFFYIIEVYIHICMCIYI